MFNQLLAYSDYGLFTLRLVVAIIFLYHAIPKLRNFKSLWFVLGVVELVSAVGMIVGGYQQIAALALAVVMIGAIFMKQVKWGIPFSTMTNTGWEFDLILLAASICILLTSGGAIQLL